jgi:catechol 2,3-dioxygenase-like lactoylglutathione lyase family enzyme
MLDILKIKETCIYTSDIEQAMEFYHKTLGLPVIQHLPGKHLFLRAGSSVLLIFNPDESKEKISPPPHYGSGKLHFAFEVQDDEYQKVKKEITSKGITIIDEVQWKSGKKSFYFHDPFGNVLEILPDKAVWD